MQTWQTANPPCGVGMLAKIGGSVRTVPGAKVVGAVGLGGELVSGMDDVIRMVGPEEPIMVGLLAGAAISEAGERAGEKIGGMDWPAIARARARRMTMRGIVGSCCPLMI